MGFFRGRKIRFLYLLALLQLVGGPLVLLQVSLFCKVALQDLPRHGVAGAVASAWHSDEFQAAIAPDRAITADPRKSHGPSREQELKPDKAKFPVIPWLAVAVLLLLAADGCRVAAYARRWTPIWPQAPPGPPPRVA